MADSESDWWAVLLTANPLVPTTDPAKVKVSEPAVAGNVEFLPATRGTVVPLVDAEETFAEIVRILRAAKSYVYISIWYVHWRTLLRAAKNKKNVQFRELLKEVAKKKVKLRILITYLDNRVHTVKLPNMPARTIQAFQGSKPTADIVEELEKYLRRVKKDLDILIAEHPHTVTVPTTPTWKQIVPGVSHEKLFIVDGKEALLGGLECVNAYHVKKKGDPANRKHDKHTGVGKVWTTRHDVHSLLTGPIVKHVEHHFVRHWNTARAHTKRVATKAPSVSVLPAPQNNYDAAAVDHACQIAVTRSIQGKGGDFQTVERGIFDAYLAAVGEAKNYIYIENQYFRDKGLAKAIAAQLNRARDLRVIVVLPRKAEEKRDEFVDHASFLQKRTLDLLAAKHASRVGVFSLGTHKGKEIYVHAKVMIVDDKWFTIGSANANPRSFFLDDDVNVLVRDNKLAKEFRLALWTEHFDANDAMKKKLERAPSTFLDLWNDGVKEGDKRRKEKKRTHVPRMEHHKPFAGVELPGGFLDRYVWDSESVPPDGELA